MWNSELLIESKTKRTDPDMLAGFFASVVLALLLSSWLAREIFSLVETLTARDLSESWSYDLTSALFLGVIFADPVSAVIYKRPLRKLIVPGLFGLLVGGALQHFMITPIAGTGLSQYMLLVFSLALLPLLILQDKSDRFLKKHDLNPQEWLSRQAVGILRLPRLIPLLGFIALGYGALNLLKLGFEASFALAGAAIVVGVLRALFLRINMVDETEVAGEDEAEEQTSEPDAAEIEFANFTALLRFELVRFLSVFGAGVVLFSSLGWAVFNVAPLPELPVDPMFLKAAALVALLIGSISFAALLVVIVGKILRWQQEVVTLRLRFLSQSLWFRSLPA